jgi:hypothetical protein
VTTHITTHQKDTSNNGNPIDVARCPCCRQDILSQSLNISLQTMITNMITLKNKLQKVEQKNIQFSNKLYETQMRCNILQEELLKCIEFKQVRYHFLCFSFMSFLNLILLEIRYF